VHVVEELGSDAYAYAYGNLHLGRDADVPRGQDVHRPGRRPPTKGETIDLKIRENEENVFVPGTGLQIGGAAASHGNL
jgi:hypothetical protein